MKRPRIILADDHRIFVEGVRRLLEPEFEVVRIVATGEALISTVSELHPDLVLCDISMPGMDGIEAARQILEADPRARLVMLTMHEDSAYATTLLSAGARGYVLKHSEPTELVTALHEVLNGKIYVSPRIASDVLREQARARRTRPNKQLTHLQRDVLRLLSEGLTAKEIGVQLNRSHKTVEYHKYRMLEQLELSTSAELIRYAVEHGIKVE